MLPTISLLFNFSTFNELAACRKMRNVIGLSYVMREKQFLLLKSALKNE
jgi:hypothetical protein